MFTARGHHLGQLGQHLRRRRGGQRRGRQRWDGGGRRGSEEDLGGVCGETNQHMVVSWGKWWFSGILWDLPSGYVKIALEDCHL